MKVNYNSRAASDLNEILAYLAEYSPKAANKQLLHFETAARRIGQNPYIGIAVGEELRRVVVGKYLVVYRVGVDTVTIEYIRHGARRRPWENE